MLDIRLSGTQEDINSAIERLKITFEVLEVSVFYPNRETSKLGRVYIKVRLLKVLLQQRSIVSQIINYFTFISTQCRIKA